MKQLGKDFWIIIRRMIIPWFLLNWVIGRYVNPVWASNEDAPYSTRFAMVLVFLAFCIAYYTAFNYIWDIIKSLIFSKRR